ncbi:hypothetical protein [Paenibacillus tengchongensis]|uniref:hypothetical protein n=1 Tax=Paenibacillus tengchongensis TaxID=2608684 RepID=UPI00124E25F1|nr:hypothetical protein [Paenibacillus tengchongensis]
MHIKDETPRSPARLFGALRLLAALVIVMFAQGFISFLLGAFSAIFLFFGEGLAARGWDSSPLFPWRDLAPLAASCLIPAALYALCWFGVWWMQFEAAEDRRISWFPLRLAFACIPLVLLILQISPEYNPDAMIAYGVGHATLIVCMGWSAVILYPFYSAGVYYFVLKPDMRLRRRYRLLILLVLFALLALPLLRVLWEIAPTLYPSLLEYPDR